MTYASGHGGTHVCSGKAVFWLFLFFFEAEVRNNFGDYSGVSRYSSPCLALGGGVFHFPFSLY